MRAIKFVLLIVAGALPYAPVSADFEFYCDYDESPLNYGADPTVFSTTRMTDPELDNPRFGVTISLINTATSGSTTVGPQTVTKPKSNVAPSAQLWRVNNALAAPPFTALWSMSGRMRRTDLVQIGPNILPIVIEDLCTVQGLVSPAAGGGGGGCAIIDPMESTLSLTGKVRSSPAGNAAPLIMRRAAEDGRQVVADEYALQVAHQLVEPISASLRNASSFSLSVRHQAAHEANSNYTPAPRVTLRPTKVPRKFEGQRGFAIAEIGASGRALNVRILPETGSSSLALEQMVLRNLRTRFQDHRRHDHTAYMAYEVSDGVLKPVGRGLITLPMCCGPGDQCNPRCP